MDWFGRTVVDSKYVSKTNNMNSQEVRITDDDGNRWPSINEQNRATLEFKSLVWQFFKKTIFRYIGSIFRYCSNLRMLIFRYTLPCIKLMLKWSLFSCCRFLRTAPWVQWLVIYQCTTQTIFTYLYRSSSVQYQMEDHLRYVYSRPQGVY